MKNDTIERKLLSDWEYKRRVLARLETLFAISILEYQKDKALQAIKEANECPLKDIKKWAI